MDLGRVAVVLVLVALAGCSGAPREDAVGGNPGSGSGAGPPAGASPTSGATETAAPGARSIAPPSILLERKQEAADAATAGSPFDVALTVAAPHDELVVYWTASGMADYQIAVTDAGQVKRYDSGASSVRTQPDTHMAPNELNTTHLLVGPGRVSLHLEWIGILSYDLKVVAREVPRMALSSPAYVAGGSMPQAYRGPDGPCPPLVIGNVPNATKSLALVFHDVFFVPVATHWIAWNLPPSATSIPEGFNASRVGGAQSSSFVGPFPPPGDEHGYRFTVYALADRLAVEKPTVEQIAAKAVSYGELTARYRSPPA